MKKPNHIGLIMDGNRRWAQKNHMTSLAGHKKGIQTLEKVLKAAVSEDIQNLSIYGFSLENWNRGLPEIQGLFRLFYKFLLKKNKFLVENEVRFKLIGDRSLLPKKLIHLINKLEYQTSAYSKLKLNIAFNYSSKWQISQSINKILLSAPHQDFVVTEDQIESELIDQGFPDIDLIIRTGGEQRLSNFFMWQSAYAELYFDQKMWPEFNDEDFRLALLWFAKRNRRFGGSPNKSADSSSLNHQSRSSKKNQIINLALRRA